VYGKVQPSKQSAKLGPVHELSWSHVDLQGTVAHCLLSTSPFSAPNRDSHDAPVPTACRVCTKVRCAWPVSQDLLHVPQLSHAPAQSTGQACV
jgi:hypothetical protein